MRKFGSKEFKSFNGDNDYDPSWKAKAFQHNAKVVANGIEICWCDIDMNQRTHQSRVMDISKGHVNNLANDIASNGLNILPTVEWNPTLQKFSLLGGHHRVTAINKLMRETIYKNLKAWTKDFPVAVLEFKSDRDRIKYLAADNNHKPARGHSLKDAAHFLQNLATAGEFDNCPKDNEAARKKLAYQLLSEFFPRVIGQKKKAVYEMSFNPIKTYKNWSPNEIKEEKANVWNIEPDQDTAGNTAYVNGNHTQWGNSVSNALNKHLKNLQNGTVSAQSKLGIKLLAHVQMTDRTEQSSFLKTLQSQRKRVLDQATLKNKYLYEAAGVACIEEIVFVPQLLTTKDVETKNMVNTWNTAQKKFV
jgi:hypothetical protein